MGVQKTAGFLTLILLAGFSFILPACENKNPPVAPLVALVNTPVPCAGVLGHQVAEATPITGDTTLWLNPFVPSVNTTLTNLSLYLASSASVTCEMGVYSNSVTSPYALLSSTAPQTMGPVTLWNTAPVSQTVPLSAGVTYWLAIHSTISDYGSGGVRWASQSIAANTYGSLPLSFSGTVNAAPFTFSIYGTTCP